MTKFPKFCVPIKVTFEDGQQEYGGVFVLQSQRVIDLLSDERPFVPFQSTKRTALINKMRVLQVEVVSLHEAEANPGVFPELDFDYLRRNTW